MLNENVVSELTDKILRLKKEHPVRVGVSGITASGKTTLADKLADELKSRRKDVIRTSIDNFHNPRGLRYRRGKESAIGYYQDAHDYESFKNKLLHPLGPGGDLRYRTISLDLAKDEYVDAEIQVATNDTVLVVDGTFLFKKDLCEFFDFKVFVETDFEIAGKRGADREAQTFGSYKAAKEMFVKRYHAASRLYLEEHSPQLRADVTVVNN